MGKEVGKLARYSQSGVSPPQVKHLKKTLDALDNNIKLPESLRGDALLYKLEGVQPDVSAGRKLREFVLPPRRSLRVLTTYAAAFVLVVGLFYILSTNRPADFHQGEIAIGGQSVELAPLDHGGGISPARVAPGTRLGELGEYLLYYRLDDLNPSNTGEAPFVLMLLDADTQEVISQVELPHTANITSFYTDGYIVTFFNGSGQLQFTYVVDFTDPKNPFVLGA
ncbi:MAG: hypothetical protein FWE19_09490 [Oscillospiraceae bacterium]|nr:hypothetical protein [Oscillospiraceae bacterium]